MYLLLSFWAVLISFPEKAMSTFNYLFKYQVQADLQLFLSQVLIEHSWRIIGKLLRYKVLHSCLCITVIKVGSLVIPATAYHKFHFRLAVTEAEIIRVMADEKSLTNKSLRHVFQTSFFGPSAKLLACFSWVGCGWMKSSFCFEGPWLIKHLAQLVTERDIWMKFCPTILEKWTCGAQQVPIKSQKRETRRAISLNALSES